MNCNNFFNFFRTFKANDNDYCLHRNGDDQDCKYLNKNSRRSWYLHGVIVGDYFLVRRRNEIRND